MKRLCLTLACASLAACTGDVVGGTADDNTVPPVDAAPGVDAQLDSAVSDPGVEGDGRYEIGPRYSDAPELTVPESFPRGSVYEMSMESADSVIYPGLNGPYTRNLWVYVPAQYVDGDAAPFMVVQDGGGQRGRTVPMLDTLIGEARMPALVVVFINSGGGDGRGSERGLEYDAVSETYTTFIETEVLPKVLSTPQIIADYPNLTLTDDPEGRASMGMSSGGAAAFTMGWFRPDLYRRILTYSGTFVNQHPTDEYPGSAWEYHQHIIAETPSKPLRVFLEVGTKDNNFDADGQGDGMHNWIAANEAMGQVLEAKGYHYRYLYALDAGHVDGRVVRQTQAQALEWLWRGYPISHDALSQ